MYVVLWSVYLSGTACGLVLPSQFGCGRCGAASRGMLPCMYVWPTGTDILIVELFWRPDLTLLQWLIGYIVQKVSSVSLRHTYIPTGYHTYIHTHTNAPIISAACMYVCMACGWLAALPVRCGYLSGKAPFLFFSSLLPGAFYHSSMYVW